jgi:hypothetical protein
MISRTSGHRERERSRDCGIMADVKHLRSKPDPIRARARARGHHARHDGQQGLVGRLAGAGLTQTRCEHHAGVAGSRPSAGTRTRPRHLGRETFTGEEKQLGIGLPSEKRSQWPKNSSKP